MDQRILPLALGLGAGVVQVALPESLGPLILVIAALAAGWSLPEAPMKAALLFLLPAVALGGTRLLVEDDSVSVGALAFGLVVTVMFTAFFTHIGAGLALRRRRPDHDR